MKWIQYSFLTCLILLSTAVFSQSKKATVDITGITIPENWKCTIILPGNFLFKQNKTYFPVRGGLFSFDLTQDKRTSIKSTNNQLATHFQLYNRQLLAASIGVDCRYDNKAVDLKFRLPGSCKVRFPVNKTVSIKGNFSLDPKKKLQFTDVSCSIK